MRMRTLCLALTALMVSAAVAAGPAADSGPPSDASIHQLFEVTHVSSLLDTYMTQIKSSMRSGMQQATAGKPLNQRQREIMDGMSDKMVALIREQLDWPSLEAQITQVYRESFTQKDVDAMLAFYRSPTGQKAIAKQPQVMQQLSQYAIGRMQDLVPRLQQLQRDTAAQMKEAAGPSSAPEEGNATGVPGGQSPPQ
jgi:uncharacterized protein